MHEESNPIKNEEKSQNDISIAKERLKNISDWKKLDDYIDTILFSNVNTLYASNPQMVGMGMGMPGPQMGLGAFNTQMNVSGYDLNANYMQTFASLGIENILKLRLADLISKYEYTFKRISANLNAYISGEIGYNINTWFENIKEFILSEFRIDDPKFINELGSFGNRIGIMKGFINVEEKQILDNEVYSIISGKIIKHNFIELADFIVDISEFILKTEKIVIYRYPFNKSSYEIKDK
jgi:hypothetical protein